MRHLHLAVVIKTTIRDLLFHFLIKNRFCIRIIPYFNDLYFVFAHKQFPQKVFASLLLFLFFLYVLQHQI